ncbi:MULTISPECIES: CoA-binding protein [Mesotoga]|uniref:CoA-binding protein n=1 Tax=Mesotoga TaxID=1184396 RepID=UPI0002CA88A9|nr:MULTISPECIES: CoA-binding protein [Mesotoga]MCP5457386.1 CoA-binding protein [Thermotogota bacterium]CCU83582.1 CoA-binding domain protein [Mesotoga infera]MCB1223732.1 CoA-binding protein [Mesotoga sp.]MCP5460752.1 CoA-binding protein [Thermotogota bacterium]RLL85995.1 CoA-binding protein [Mesotoga sp. H07pep.5.4]
MIYKENAKKILETFKTVVVVGFSKSPEKAANYVPIYLIEMGYRIVPVNPSMEEYSGLKVYPDLEAVVADGIELEVVEIFRPSEEAESIALKAIELGAKAVWLQKGIYSEKAQLAADENGVVYVEDLCMFEEHRRISL